MYILRFINQNKNDNNNNYWKFATFHTFKFTHWWKSSQTLHNHEYQQYETCWMYEHALAILNSLYTYILATYTVKRSSQIDEWYIVQCTYNINANTSKKKKRCSWFYIQCASAEKFIYLNYYDIKILLVSVLSRNHPSSFDSISIVFKQR